MTSRLKSLTMKDPLTYTKDLNLTKNVPIEVNPPEIVFKDIQINQIYQITVEIRNLTKKATRIRLQKPLNQSFKIQYNMQQEIAPGLAMLAKIKYQSKELKNQIEKVIIQTDDGYKLDLPIRVYKMQSQLLFQPFVNIGFVKVGKSKSEKIVFKNQGKAPGIVQLSHDHSPLLKLEPSLLKIAPQQVAYLTLTFKSQEAGLFKGVINLKSESMLLKNTIDVHATSVEYAKFFIDNKGSQQTTFDFGNMYVGQFSEIESFLVNNSPKKIKFKTNFRLGFKISPEQFSFVQSPSELGHQQNQRIMHCEPSEGQVNAFSQIPIRFICKSKITYKQQIYTKNYAITPVGEQVPNNPNQKAETEFKPQNQHQYSVLFDFFQQQPLVLQLKGVTSCPLIKIEKTIFQFGDCPSHQYRHIAFKIQNINPANKIQLMFPKIPNFTIQPNYLNLQNKSSVQLVAAFEPKNIGKFDTNQALILNKLYQIPLRFFGISSTAGKKDVGKRGPQGLSKDFIKQKTFIKQIPHEQTLNQRKKAFSLTTQKSFLNKIKTLDLQQHKVVELTNIFDNKDRFNQVLKDRRLERAQIQKQISVEKKWATYTEKMKQLGLNKKYEQKQDEQGIAIAPPLDYEFQVGMLNTKIIHPHIPLPENKDRLFVTRHIGPHEPREQKKNTNQKYSPNPNQKPKKIQSQKPRNFNQQREIVSEITSQELQKIEVGPLSIDFGQVFVKSSTSKYFWIKNSTRKAIAARLQIDIQQFKKSYIKPQIISSCTQAGFEITLYKDTIGQVRKSIKYILNEKYVFQISIVAHVIPVALQISRNNIKFVFTQQNLQMSTTEQIKLINSGNSKALFKFTLSKQRLYVPEILEGQVDPASTKQIKIKFVAPIPQVNKAQYNYTEKLMLKILDGLQSTITCSCTLIEPKLTIKPSPLIDFPPMCIGQEISKYLNIRNVTKSSAIIHLEANDIQGLTCNGKYRFVSDESKDIELKYKAIKQGQNNGKILLKVRGSKDRIVEVKTKIINPIIKCDQLIDYQYVIVGGYPGVRKFTLNNTSQVEVPLIIDIREHAINSLNPKGVQCLQIKLVGEQSQLEIIFPQKKVIQSKPQTSNANNKNKQPENIISKLSLQQDEQISNNSEEEVEKQVDKKELRKYKLVMKPNKQYVFEIKFYAKEIKQYEFKIPIFIENYGITNSPIIKCKGIKPQFLFEPQVIDFKRKIITTPDKCFPRYIPINITNPDTKSIHWSIDDSTIIKDQIFTLQKKSGKLNPGETQIIKAGFNPYEIGQYSTTLPLFIQDDQVKQKSKYLDIQIKGSSAFPSINFNKRQVILPVVPLGITTSTSFRIFNDGYQNVNLKAQILEDIANLNIKISFPEGKNLGITKQKIKVQIKFKFLKPISFCSKLQITDDMNRSYIIPVSGTTDNTYFTNYAYFLRSQGKYKIDIKESLQVVEQEEDDQNPKTRKNSAHSMRSSKTNATNKSLISYLGSSMIKPGLLENTIQYLTRYLNSNILTSRIDEFPRSFIDSDGSQLFEIISFFTPKNSNFPWRCTIKQKGVKKTQALYNQYCQLIKMLKIQGAHLNHIRPQYLLSYNDLNIYLSQILTKQQSKYYSSSLLKVNPALFNYLSMDSWITLLYQMFRIYLLFRINMKTYKTHIGQVQKTTNKHILDVPKGYLEGSNYISSSEGILIYWIESCVLEILLQQRRITNFDKDFKDGIMIAVLLQKYANVKSLRNMKKICNTEQDYKNNADQVIKGLEQIGLNSHMQAKDIYNPLQRQMLLFLLYLYNYLPFYTPKAQPIEFKCILGQELIRNIQLTNPSNKPVYYQAKYEGSPDFTLLSEEIFKIESKQGYKFQVKFISRISTPVFGRVTFINKKQNSIAAAALVFDLKSNITGKISQKIWNVSGMLYEQVDFPIQITNKFLTNQVADFSINILTEYIYDKKNTKQNNFKQLAKQQELPTIFIKNQNIKLRKNTPTQFYLSYIPTSLNTTKTTVIFSNPLVGEFQHQITATVQLPPPLVQIKPPMTLTVDQVVNWQYPIQMKNDALLKAKKLIDTFKKGGKKTPKETKRPLLEQTSQSSLLYVQIPPNPFISSKQSITLNQKKQTLTIASKKKQEELVSSQNKIPFTIICKNPVYQYAILVTLKNSERTDIRRYKLLITVQPRPLKAILQMNVPARSQVTQNLPIINNTEKDWPIKITWLPDPQKNGNYFSIPAQFSKDFQIKKKSTGNFPLTFKPKWVQKAQAKLIMQNPITMDQFEYDIKGNGQQPLAEEHIQIKCESKQKYKKEIIVKNPYAQKSVVFNVETDLLNCTSVKTLTIPAGGKQKFEFVVQPMLSGQYTGSITFTEEQGGQYIWYTVSVITNYPTTLKHITLATQIRKLLVYQLDIPNTQNKNINYQVIIAGQGLSGEPLYQSSTKKYYLKYLPFKVGTSKGSICFINPDIGEILYQFELICQNRPITKLHGLRSPLGVPKSIKLQFENPSQISVNLNITNSNVDVYEINTNTLKLLPNQKKILEVIYTPSNLQALEETNIIATSKDIGNWEFNLQGIGLPPVTADTYVVYNSLFQEQTNIIKFRNPFKYDISVGIRISYGLRGEEVFKLIKKGKNNIQSVKPYDILQIPFSFIPIACQRYQCSISVVISQKIQWIFPIQGITQVNKNQTILHLKTKCRQKAKQSKQIYLEGIQDVNIHNGYQYQLQNISNSAKVLVEKFFSVQQLKSQLSHEKDYLEFEFLYKPLKPSKFTFDFVIKKNQGPKWRYKITLEATEPQPDDIINFQSSLLVTSSVAFRLTNWQKQTAEFQAKFTSDSANEFSVQPKQGILAPYGNTGTNFMVSFTPIQYGKEKKGKLIIETNDMFWSYLLKGSLPKYNPPKALQSTLDNRSTIKNSTVRKKQSIEKNRDKQ